MHPSLTVRRLTTGAVAVVLALAALGIGYRVLAPAETLTPAVRPYPAEPAVAMTRPGAIADSPLIVDSRLRVYADKARVWADLPVGHTTQMSPFWAYRRWPAQVVGVAAVSVDARHVVVTRWSDGDVVAIDARTGRVAWRASGPTPPVDHFDGRRTGASVVYEPAGLFTSRAAGGRPVLVVAGQEQVRAYDPGTGAELWAADQEFCPDVAFTGRSTYVTLDSCRGGTELTVRDAATGRTLGDWRPRTATADPRPERPTGGDGPVDGVGVPVRGGSRPLLRASPAPTPTASASPGDSGVGVEGWLEVMPFGCAVGRSECALLQVRRGAGTARWRLEQDGAFVPEPHARSVADIPIGDALVQSRDDDYVALVDRATGERRWVVPLNGEVLTADADGVYVLTPWFALVTLDPATGRPMRLVNLRRQDDRDKEWIPGYVYARDGFLAVERLTGRVGGDDRYYFHKLPVIIASV